METRRYGYKYAIIESNGWCVEEQDTTDYILDPTYVPIDDDNGEYLMKYYWPIPTTVTSFSNFQGKWYLDEDHITLAPGLN